MLKQILLRAAPLVLINTLGQEEQELNTDSTSRKSLHRFMLKRKERKEHNGNATDINITCHMKDIPNEQKLSWKLRFWTPREFKGTKKLTYFCRILPVTKESSAYECLT